MPRSTGWAGSSRSSKLSWPARHLKDGALLLYAFSHQVKHRIGVFPSLFTSLLLREGRVRLIWSGADKALFARRSCVCRLPPALFDGILDDQTIVGLA